MLNLRKGTISAIDPKAHRARVLLPDLSVETFWLACLSLHSMDSASYWMPDLQQHVWVLCDQSLRDGVILGGYYNEEVPPIASSPDLITHKSKDGSLFSFDRQKHEFSISIQGGDIKLSNSGGASVILKNDGTIELKCIKLKIEASTSIDTTTASVAYQTASHTLNGKDSATIDAVDNAGELIVSRGW